MKRTAVFAGFLSVLLLIFLAAPLFSAEPEQLPFPAFSVVPATASGTPTERFGLREIPHFDMKFALALSATRTYNMRVTLIQNANGKISESVLFEGNLPEGTYRFLAAGEQPLGTGEIKATVVMRVRMFTKKFTGDDFYIYRQWDGTYSFGK